MIYSFKEAEISDKNGNKANSLVAMKAAGFNVPDGFILNSDCFDDFLIENLLEKQVSEDLAKENADGLSEETLSVFDEARLNPIVRRKITEYTRPGKKYAVRSSCTKEDLGDLSFAGQYKTYLFVSPEEIEEKIIACYKSTYSSNIVAYCRQNNIELKSLKMAVVVQEMVDSDYSGICFTVDPVTGNDKDMLIELAQGIGEEIVSGHNAPEQYHYSWFNNATEFDKKNKILGAKKLRELGETFADIQLHFGFPCDIEFALKNDKLYILQARKITKIVYGGYTDVWTTADFKDGGVSATVCTPYMWSLYEYTWDYVLPKFIADSKILSRKYLDQHVMGDMFFGRPYWNLSVVKEAMSKVVGYREREFDNEYGIKGKYDGDGVTTKLLKENGYKNYLLLGSDSKYGCRKNYFEQHGKYQIYDLNTAIKNNEMTEDDIVWWGFDDEDLYAKAKKQLTQISKKDEPFNYTMLTVDTHFEDGYLDEKCKEKFKDQYSNVIYCADDKVGEFIDWIKEQDFYDDTVIVVVRITVGIRIKHIVPHIDLSFGSDAFDLIVAVFGDHIQRLSCGQT